MTSSETVVIQLLNKSYPIKCDASQVDELQVAARYLDGKLREIYNNCRQWDFEQIVLTAALNLSHELTQARATQANPVDSAVTDKINSLTNMIDEALTEQEEL